MHHRTHTPSTTCRRLLLLAAALAAPIAGLEARAAVAYDESASGDLSGNGLAPTVITVTTGDNHVLGTTGRINTADREYFSFTVPAGLQWTSLDVLAGTEVGNAGFIGVQAGAQVTLPTNTPDATGLLGWRHYTAADIGSNILEELGVAAFGSTGFTAPLGPGTYSVWLQDTSAGLFDYGFNFGLERTPVVPEAGNGILLGGALGTLIVARRRLAARR